MAKLLDEFKAKQLKKQADQNKKIDDSLTKIKESVEAKYEEMEAKHKEIEAKNEELEQKLEKKLEKKVTDIALPIQEIRKSLLTKERKDKEQDNVITDNKELTLKTKEELKVHESDKKAHPSEETIKNIIDVKIPPEKWTKLTDGSFADELHKHALDEFGKRHRTIARGGAVAVRRNSTGTELSRRRLNFIEGTSIGLTVADDSTNNEVDITINNTAAGFTDPMTTRGDIIVRDSTNTTARLARIANGSSYGADANDVVAVAPVHSVNNFRLTLTSGTSVTTSDVTGATTIYLTPHDGNSIGLFDGTNWQILFSAEVSLALGTLTADANYDVFAFNSSGTLTLELSDSWTNDTTRANAIARQNGVWIKSGTTTRRLVGTFRTTSTTATEDSEAKRFVWNVNNRILRPLRAIEDVNSWTYTTATWRSANNDTTNRLEWVTGLNEEMMNISVLGTAENTIADAAFIVGIDIDGTNTNDAILVGRGKAFVANIPSSAVTSTYVGFPGLGYHFAQWIEQSEATGTTTWFGDGGISDRLQAGIYGWIMA